MKLLWACLRVYKATVGVYEAFVNDSACISGYCGRV